MKLRQVFCGVLAGLLITALCFAENAPEWTVEDSVRAAGESSVAWPVLRGGDPETEAAVNSRILADCRINEYLARMEQLPGNQSMNVGWEGMLAGDVFSCACHAEGAVEFSRPTFVWTWSNMDLRTGEEIPMDALFTDPEEGRAALEGLLEETVGPELSGYLLNSEVTPLPEGFVLGTSGLTLLYPVDQLSTLSDRAGDIHIAWCEIREWLDLEEGSVLARMSVPETLEAGAESGNRIRETAESGSLPGIPVRIGDSVQELTDRHHLLIDPDGFDGGRMFSLEGGCFREVYLLTDDLGADWEQSRVQGIRMDRGSLYGLNIGTTTREEWREILGEPDSAVDLDEERAAAKRREPGACDYYRLDGVQLQLYCDEGGTLNSITLTE